MQRFFFFGILMISLTACKKERKETDNQTTIALGECGKPRIDGANPVTVCFDALLEDSRCQPNMQCVWQGAAKGRLTFTADGGTHTLELSTTTLLPGYRQDTVIAGYRIHLIDITPFPSDARSIKKAIVEVTR